MHVAMSRAVSSIDTMIIRVLVQGRYDRVHVGASCRPDRLPALLELLRPEGGLLVTPVSPADLRVFTKTADGITSKLLSQVRYGDLEVRIPATCSYS